jgi:hypothetical protein
MPATNTITPLDWALKYLNNGLSVIPVKGLYYSSDERDIKTPFIKWQPYTQRLPSEEEVLSWFQRFEKAGVAIVTGKVSGIVVVDFDSSDAIEFARRNNLLNTVIVKTRKGLHAYYAYPDREIRNTVNIRGMKIDIRGEGGYVVAPPTEYPGGKYEWMVEFSRDKLAPFPQVFFDARNRNENGACPSQHLSQEQIELITQQISSIYRPGIRQQVCLALSGILRKSGFAMEDAIALISYLHAIHHDEDPIQQRISAATYTWAKTEDQIAAWSLLPDLVADRIAQILMPEPEPDNEDIIQDTIVVDDIMYIARDGSWYAVECDDRGTMLSQKRVCPYFVITKRYLRETQEVGYSIHTYDDRVITLDQLDTSSLERTIGRPIIHQQKFRILLDELIKRATTVNIYTRTGWHSTTDNRDIFLYPLLETPGIEVILGGYQKMFVARNIDKQHKLVLQLLKEGRLAGAKIVFAVASLFGGGFTVVDIGPRGIGKTITSAIACSIFYDSSTPRTAFATRTAMELYMRTFTNLPVMFDEAALSFDDQLQLLIFLVSSKKGKARGTISLTINESDLFSTVFVTNEREIDLDRYGAYRRVVVINAHSLQDYTHIDLSTLLEHLETCSACGKDYISFLLEHHDELNNTYDAFLHDFHSFAFRTQVEKAVVLLEKFYNTSLDNTKAMIYTLLAQQHEEVNRDIFDIFFEKFTEWISSNYTQFIRSNRHSNGEITYIPSAMGRECLGYWDTTHNVVYVYTNVFRQWCIEEKLPFQVCLQLAKTRKRLIPGQGGSFRTIKHIPLVDIKASVYCFSLDQGTEVTKLQKKESYKVTK